MHIDVQGCASWNCDKTRPCGLGSTQRVVDQMEIPSTSHVSGVLWKYCGCPLSISNSKVCFIYGKNVKTQENGYALSIYIRVHPEGPAHSSEACPKP